MLPNAESKTDAAPGFAGMQVCSFESRKAQEMQSLIRRQGGVPTVAPSMQEVSLDENAAAIDFADRLFRDELDVVVFMTGVGAEATLAAVESRYSRQQFLDALRATCCVVRGPKPAAVFRKWDVPFFCQAPEPNTWRELLSEIEAKIDLDGKRVAVQEYGVPSTDFYEELRSRGATVFPVTVYRWELPDDTAPLKEAIRTTIEGQVDVLLFTSAQQLHHILQVADESGQRAAWLAAAAKCVVASIGPTASEHLRGAGLSVDLEPTHPKMGHLVREAAAAAAEILKHKRSAP